MEKYHPHSGATYRLVPQKDSAFGVEVTIPDMHPTTVTGFATQADAEMWIAKHKERLASGDNPLKRRFTYRKS